jgi:hypothetical protein
MLLKVRSLPSFGKEELALCFATGGKLALPGKVLTSSLSLFLLVFGCVQSDDEARRSNDKREQRVRLRV